MDKFEDSRLGVQESEVTVMDENHGDEFEDEDDNRGALSPEMEFALADLASMLCSICQSLCRGEVKVVKYREDNGDQSTVELEHHPSLSSLRESVDSGCPLCKDLIQHVEECLHTKPEVKDSAADSWYTTCWLDRTQWCNVDGVDGLSFHFTFYDSNGQPVSPKLGASISMSFIPVEKLGLGPEYLECASGATNAMFTPNIALAKRWFDTCLNDHNCRDEGRPRVFPSRLIEVWTHGGKSGTTKARLCGVEDFSEDASYLTLSHCWGNNTLLTLTKENLKILKRGIPVNQLPPLFQDALHMTSELGMRYIWIDCLCIIQDCQDDWAYEAARMGDIYRSAKCNIAASGYKDGKAGLFKKRIPLPLLNFPLYLDRVLIGNKETVGQDVRTPFKGIYVRGDNREFYDAITKGPLNSRGWVVQERALSPAILHFTQKQMWWECKSHIASESFPDISVSWNMTQEYNAFGPNALRPLSTESHILEVYLSWNNFVSFYAGTNLTVESDRFPALNGIARAFSELTKDNLIAGFWEGDLIQSLAWWIPDQDRAKKIPCSQRAPTWSWAFLSMPHKPAYQVGIMTKTCLCTCREILSDDPGFRSDLHYTTLTKSAVRGLELTGPLRKLNMKMGKLSELSEWRGGVCIWSVNYDVADSSFFSAQDIANPEQAWHWEEPRHILPLIKLRGRKQVPGLVNCLLLNQVPGVEHSNVFRRLGVVKFYFEDDDSWDEFLGIDNDNGKSKLSTVFEDCGQHDLILI